jgi:hypothetical protein
MMQYGRRLLIHAWLSAKEQFAALVAERDHLQGECDQLRRDLANVRRQRDDAIETLLELRAAVRARYAAEQELASLYREREIQRAGAAERDFGQPLQ